MEQEMSAMDITRSRRVYQGPEPADKGKAPAAAFPVIPEATPLPTKKVIEQEVEAFMKVIKASEYKVAEQMCKSSAHISLLALLLSSEPHRDALMKVLTTAQVLKNTAPDRIEETVNSIFSNQISFAEDELPSEGQAHLRALHIICKCNNHVVGRVMIDNGSALNVCPISTLKQMNMDMSRIWSLAWETLIPTASAFPSLLHQKLKFFVEGKLITVNGEEEYAVYKETIVPYIIIGEDQNLPFHSFDTISVIRDYGEVGHTHREFSAQLKWRSTAIGGDLVFALPVMRSCKLAVESISTVLLYTTEKLSRSIPVPPLSQFFPAPPQAIGSTFDSSSTEAHDSSSDTIEAFLVLPTIYAVTEEMSSRVHIRPAREDEELTNWTAVLLYSVMVADVKKFTEGESNYPEIEKMCCTLVWVMQRLQQYTLYHTIRLLSKTDPLKYLLDNEGILQVNDEEESRGWKMYFDGAVNSTGSSIGAVLISPEGRHFPVTANIDFPYTNNVTEYEVCILGFRAAVELKVKELKVFGDSMLTIFQTLKQWKTKDPKLEPYHEYLEELTENFENISFTYTPRMRNQFVDALATLAFMVRITKENLIEPYEFEIAKGPAHCDVIEAVDGKPWHCHLCQVYANKIRAPHNELHPMAAPWLFSMSGMDIIGPINPKASKGHLFILVAIDDFTKWIESITLASVTTKAMARFLKRDIIARYGVPATLITNNAKNLNNELIGELCAQFKIQQRNSSPYCPQMNGAVEATNKNIKKIIEKMTMNYKDWHEMLLFALLAYQTSIRSSTGATPYSLVYGMEAVLPVKVEIPSMRVLAESKLKEAEWAKQCYEQLNLIDEKRLTVLCHDQCFQQRMARVFDKRVCLREFSPGDLVLQKFLHIAPDSRGKFAYKYDGHFIVKEVFDGGAKCSPSQCRCSQEILSLTVFRYSVAFDAHARATPYACCSLNLVHSPSILSLLRISLREK
ncbi:hypothetical protein CRG98_013066 [Punica granatum]|uniref:Integrase catalytic domain-containing protein n=1 Tax=Punica granatum TaxID=22663 RepID=A0A2I0KDC8_PUNGR|nr:hypothetical protein CRG98_013066 [Punica granatum]